MNASTHFHLFTPGTRPDGIPMAMLHGSGGDEHDLMPLAAELAPDAPTLFIRGTVAIDGGFAFFHRRPDRSIDEADVEERIPSLVEFIEATSTSRGFTKRPVVVGFSNGAIMAAALLLTHPALFSGAILLRPLSPFLAGRPTRLDATPVLVIDGEKDSRRSPGDGARLADGLRHAGATVTHHVLPVGHSITQSDRRIARDWLMKLQ
jgi:phospholipase/carboxylesterase